MASFWDNLPRPFFVLAPMADVTDAAFRRIIAKYSRGGRDGNNKSTPQKNVRYSVLHKEQDAWAGGSSLGAMWTEFVSADGLMLAPEEGRKKLLADLMYSEAERPIVAQFFSGRPEMMEKAAALARELGFDGVDINMGCPDKSIEKQGAGAAMIKNPSLAKEIIAAAKAGAGDLPVSVKTRIGYNKNELDTWLPALFSAHPVAVTLHLRTRKEMSLVNAHWEELKRAVQMRNEIAPEVLMLGNGDAKDIPDAKARVTEAGADGAMLGRAIFGNPWLFSEHIPSLEEKLNVMVEHTKLYEELLPHKSFAIMKKHYKAYVAGFDGAAELRARLMDAPDSKTIKEIIDKFLEQTVDKAQ
jgi:nifR3 family TIM-barrel protein